MSSTIEINGNIYAVNAPYLISGDVGKNPSNYQTLSSFGNEQIDARTGYSDKFPNHHFGFKLVKSNSFDSGFASIYELIITKNIIIKGHLYVTDITYFISGDVGNNPSNFPTLSSFCDEQIDARTGYSVKYPNHHFGFELVNNNSYDSGFARIYKLIITKI